MANPFEKRATEYLREDEAAFLSLVSPEPLRTYLGDAAKRGQLFEKLIRIVGTPGSGKTTLATLLEARMVEAVLSDPEKDGYSDIIQALEACQFIQKGQQKIAAVRLPLEGEYRDFWELPYDETLRTKLVLALIQARAVLGLVRNLERRSLRLERCKDTILA
ncbi:DNA helicase HerA-like ATPase [Bradyrhizobium sp. USDA 4011]